jgi:hypothetical protein
MTIAVPGCIGSGVDVGEGVGEEEGEGVGEGLGEGVGVGVVEGDGAGDPETAGEGEGEGEGVGVGVGVEVVPPPPEPPPPELPPPELLPLELLPNWVGDGLGEEVGVVEGNGVTDGIGVGTNGVNGVADGVGNGVANDVNDVGGLLILSPNTIGLLTGSFKIESISAGSNFNCDSLWPERPKNPKNFSIKLGS